MPGQPVTYATDIDAGVLLVRRGGTHAITGQGHLHLPARIHRSLRLAAGQRLLIAAIPDHDLLIAYTMAAVDAMVLAFHATTLRQVT